ncbi:MAG: FAD-dependent oxidoreductase [Elusimicrobiota bacterium]
MPLPIGVLGGGLCGLLVGNELRRRRTPFLILEAEPEPGGLARTVRLAGMPADLGPHAIYGHDRRSISWFRSLPLRFASHRRKVRVVHHGSDGRVHEVDYPFENGIGDLPLQERMECLLGTLEAHGSGRTDFAQLRDWIDNGLGSGIARHFMVPYNSKIWNAPLEKISMDLVSRKIEPAPVRTVVESALGIRSIGRTVQARFLYPRGGIGKVAEALAKPIADRLVLNAPVRSIRDREVATPKGRFRFSGIISTIPLPELLRACRLDRRGLVGNTTEFVGVTLKRGRSFKRFADCHWLFFAGPELFYRADMMHVFHGSRTQHLVAEITLKGAASRLSGGRRQARVLRDLRKAGILGAERDVEAVESRVVRWTYPIPTVGLPKLRARMEAVLSRRGIRLLGRSGRWDYLNMDQLVGSVRGSFGGK